MRPLVDLSGQRVLVTGASSGIGRATARLLADLGADLVLTGRRVQALDETRAGLADPARAAVVPCDLSMAGAATALARAAGPVSGLVHAAGLCPISAIAALDDAARDAALRVNAVAFLDLMRHYARSTNRLAATDGFSAVAVASVSARAGWPGGAAYCAAKGAVAAAVRALAVELAPRGVRVNAVSPANIETPMLAAQAEALGRDLAADAKRPLGIGRAGDVAASIAFLLSPAARFITGVDLPVDGGYLAQ